MDELLKRVERLESEFLSLKGEVIELKSKKRLISPDVVEIIDQTAAKQCRHDEITGIMKKMIEERGSKGITLHAGLYDDPYAKRFAWWVTTCPIEHLLKIVDKPENVLNFLSPLNDIYRLKILHELVSGTKSASELGYTLDIKGGQLYHHLNSLLKRNYISRDKRGRYSLTANGWQAYITIMHLTWVLTIKIPPQHHNLIKEALERAKLGWVMGKANGTTDELMAQIKGKGILEELVRDGIHQENIREHLREYYSSETI